MTLPGTMPRRTGDAGLTLAETLVVLAVIAIATGAAITGLLPRRADSAAAEAARLADLMTLASDQALARQQVLELVLSDDGYRFRLWSGSEGQWLAPPDGPLSVDRALPRGVALTPESGPRTVRFAPDGLSSARAITVADGTDRRLVQFDGLAATIAGGVP
jgi:prepilin-type N-terminal cleavage/methylation domain-containing protein